MQVHVRFFLLTQLSKLLVCGGFFACFLLLFVFLLFLFFPLTPYICSRSCFYTSDVEESLEEGFCIHRPRSYSEMCPVCQGTPCCSREDLSLESSSCMNLLGNNQDIAFDLKRPHSRSAQDESVVLVCCINKI